MNGDTKFEQDENFTVVLSNVMNDRGQRVEGAPAGGVGTIVNDDARPTFTIDNVSMNEGASGTTNFVFTVTKTGMTAGNSRQPRRQRHRRGQRLCRDQRND